MGNDLLRCRSRSFALLYISRSLLLTSAAHKKSSDERTVHNERTMNARHEGQGNVLVHLPDLLASKILPLCCSMPLAHANRKQARHSA